MRTTTHITLLTLLATFSAACDSDKKTDTTANAADSGENKAGGAKESAASNAPPSAHDKALLALASCTPTRRGFKDPCEAAEALDKLFEEKEEDEAWSKAMLASARKLLTHEKAGVRGAAAYAIDNLTRGQKRDKETLDALLQAAGSEKDTAVLYHVLYTLQHEIGKDPRVAKAVFELSKHESPKIREDALMALGSKRASGVSGRVERFIEVMQSDSDDSPRGAACIQVGKLGDERALPMLEKLTGPEVPRMLYSDCMRGLVSMWFNFPDWNTSSEAAYRLTLDRLRNGPRDKDHPSWVAVSKLEELSNDFPKNASQKWHERAKWYKPQEVVAVLIDIAADDRVGTMARTSAVRAVGKIGGTKALAKVAKKCRKCDDKVKKAIKEAKAKAKAKK